jgi:hypothetical protein
MVDMRLGVNPHLPGPPPGAGAAFAAAAALVPFADAAFALAGAADAEVFGLKKSASVFFAGDADTAGLAAAPAWAFVRARLARGVPAEETEADGAGEVAASDFLCVRCFFSNAGDSAGVGDCACTTQVVASPITETSAKNFVFMRMILGSCQDRRQGISRAVLQ